MNEPIKQPKKQIKNRPLTRKEANFVKVLVEEPKKPIYQAYKDSYSTDNMKLSTIYSEANKTMKKPQVVSALAYYNNLIEDTLVNTVSDWGRSEKPREREIALDSAKFVHDKIHGKSTQRVEQTSTSVHFSIDLTGMQQDTSAQDIVTSS